MLSCHSVAFCSEVVRMALVLTRDDAGLVLIGEWAVSDPELQRAAADAAVDAWGVHAWPDGLRAHHCLLGEDGRTVLHHLQWADAPAARAFAATGRPAWKRFVDDVVPGIMHRGATAYRRYRDTVALPTPPPTGCLVTVTVDFDGSDPRRPRAWVDNVFRAAGTANASVQSGMLAAHFHVSVDGSRALNLAEWTTAEAHRDAVAGPTTGFRARVRAFPGVTRNVTRRYVPYRQLAA
jgi:hypothetical protein